MHNNKEILESFDKYVFRIKLILILFLIILIILLLCFLDLKNNIDESSNYILTTAIVSFSILLFVLIYLYFFSISSINKIKELSVNLINWKAKESKKENKPEISADMNIVERKFDIEKIIELIQKEISKEEISTKYLSLVSKQIEVVQALLYLKEGNTNKYKLVKTFAIQENEGINVIEEGVGITGQVIKDKKPLLISDIPEDYINIESGLGKGIPRQILILPMLLQDEVIGITEFAFFKELSETDINDLSNIGDQVCAILQNATK